MKRIFSSKFLLFILIFSAVLYSCKKENSSQTNTNNTKIKKEDFTPTEYFSIPTNFKIWKNYKPVVVDDSLKKISGDFENYKIVGFINHLNHKKYWWSIVNKNINDDSVSIEYTRYNNKELINQFVYYNEGMKDLKNSQFYEKEILENINTIRLKFYTPYQKSSSAGKLMLYFFNDKDVKVKHSVIKCKNASQFFYADIKYTPKDSYILKGLYEESSTSGKKHFVDIFVLDSIK